CRCAQRLQKRASLWRPSCHLLRLEANLLQRSAIGAKHEISAPGWQDVLAFLCVGGAASGCPPTKLELGHNHGLRPLRSGKGQAQGSNPSLALPHLGPTLLVEAGTTLPLATSIPPTWPRGRRDGPSATPAQRTKSIPAREKLRYRLCP